MQRFVANMEKYAIDIGMYLGYIDNVSFRMNTYGLIVTSEKQAVYLALKWHTVVCAGTTTNANSMGSLQKI